MQRLPAIQAVHEHKTISKPLEVSTALPLKWLTEKQVGIKQWPLTEDKLQALEHLVWGNKMLTKLKNQPALGILLYLLLKRNLVNGE